MKSGRRDSGRGLGEIVLEPWVVGVDEFARGAVEYDTTFIEHKKFSAVVDSTVGDRFYLSGLLIESVSGEEKGVLQAMGDDQGGCVGDVPLLDDEIDDGG